MTKFYAIGSYFINKNLNDTFILSQTDSGIGNYISITTGNRLTNPFTLTYNFDFGRFGQGFGLYDNDIHVDLTPMSLPVSSTAKEPVVSFYRYIRPLNQFEEIDPRQGITLSVEIDYSKKIISYGVSYCNDENFDRKVGKILADQNLDNKKHGLFFQVNLNDEEKVSQEGTVYMLYEYFIMNRLLGNFDKVQARTADRFMLAFEAIA